MPRTPAGGAASTGRFGAAVERVRGSLFLIPMIYVVGGAAAGQLGLVVDDRAGEAWPSLPLGVASTVDSARSVLSTVASATITVAGIAFSISLLIFQLASSQYSPRVVHGLFRDPFNKQVIGIVVGTFTYCLVVLRGVRGPTESADAVIPNISVGIAGGLGIVAVGAIVAFIDHSAHSMEVSTILARTTEETIARIREAWPDLVEDREHEAPPPEPAVPGGEGTPITFDASGWVRAIDVDAVLAGAPEGSLVRCETDVGRYAVQGTAVCTVWPRVPDAEVETVGRAVHDAVRLGRARALENDVAYGLRQLADVALRALSPGVNDPTTAQDAIFHEGTVLSELLRRRPPPRVVRGDGDRTLLLPQRLGHRELVDLAVDEVRRSAAPHPKVCTYLLQMIRQLADTLPAGDERTSALRRQAALVVRGAEHEDLLSPDLREVQELHDRHFRSGARRA